MATDGLALFTIYRDTRDFPGEFVARRSIANRFGVWQDAGLAARGPTLDAVRAQLPPDLFCLPRSANDDPVIVETWL